MADYSEFTVVSLKEELKKRGLPVSGRKAELVERLTANDQQGAGTPDVDEAPAEENTAEPCSDAAATTAAGDAPEGAAYVGKQAHTGGDARPDQSEEDELSLGDSEDDVDNEANPAAAPQSEQKQPKEQPKEKKEAAPEPAAAEAQPEEKPEEHETETQAKDEQPPELHSESSKGRFKPITFPADSISPGKNPPSGGRSTRASVQEPPTNITNAATPSADIKPAPQPDIPTPKSTPTRRRDSTELASKDSAPASNAVTTNGTEQSGSKRKRPVIVFDPQPTAAPESPPQKRDKVELVVGVATEVTCALRVNGLKRPLRETDLKSILEETGDVKGFWIDSCKTHCYVVYPTLEEAQATYAALDGREWPPRCRSVMKPKYVTPEEAKGMIESRGNATLRRVDSAAADDDVAVVDAANTGADGGRGEQNARKEVRGGERGVGIAHRVSDAGTRRSVEVPDMQGGAGVGAAGVRRDSRRLASSDLGAGDRAGSGEVIDMVDASEGQDAREPQSRGQGEAEEDEEMNDLESERRRGEKGGEMDSEAPAPTSLFRLTNTQPALYWLPLGEEEVQQLREVSAARKQSRELRSAGRGGGGAAGSVEGDGGDAEVVEVPEGDAQEPENVQKDAADEEGAAKDSDGDVAPQVDHDADVDAVEVAA